ncbi:hypothetical protein RhiirA5_394828 [Rhizophagus irregularis]|uniref:RNase H type-1 domain-containing protein n=1 Tax=Rhizophagus irregularis TaxID=588596 RepID=A0A2N0Q9H5_9GLOM|nr:hypothetical protein RhiirA5_394828 [Rhizophagus irregularis]
MYKIQNKRLDAGCLPKLLKLGFGKASFLIDMIIHIRNDIFASWSMEEEKFKKLKVLRSALSATLQSRRHVLIYLISALVLGCWDIGFNSWVLDRHEISVTSSLDLWTCEILNKIIDLSVYNTYNDHTSIIQVLLSAISELLIWRYRNMICGLSDDYQVTDILPIFHHSTDDLGSPIFGKQLLVQASRGTCSIVHWISPDCESSPGDLIRLSPCPGCAAHIPLPPSKKRNTDLTLCTPTVSLRHSLILPTTNERIRRNTSEVTSPFTWADIEDDVRLYYSRLDFDSDSLSADTVVAPVTPVTIESSAAAVFANSPLVISLDSRYIFFTDGSLINLGTPNVSMGWSWMQIVPDAGFPNSIATYAHGLIRDNPSSSRAEVAAIYAVLTISPRDSEVTIYTDSQTAIDGL